MHFLCFPLVTYVSSKETLERPQQVHVESNAMDVALHASTQAKGARTQTRRGRPPSGLRAPQRPACRERTHVCSTPRASSSSWPMTRCTPSSPTASPTASGALRPPSATSCVVRLRCNTSGDTVDESCDGQTRGCACCSQLPPAPLLSVASC